MPADAEQRAARGARTCGRDGRFRRAVPAFVANAAVDVTRAMPGEHAGFVVFGGDCAWIGVRKTDAGLRLVVREARAAGATPEAEAASAALDRETVGRTFTARPGRWAGTKIGLFAVAPAGATRRGQVDADWFRIGR